MHVLILLVDANVEVGRDDANTDAANVVDSGESSGNPDVVDRDETATNVMCKKFFFKIDPCWISNLVYACFDFIS